MYEDILYYDDDEDVDDNGNSKYSYRVYTTKLKILYLVCSQQILGDESGKQITFFLH
jgi:hypothetical protein